MSRPTVVLELAANPRFVDDVNAGGVFVPGCALAVQSECDLVVRAPTGEMTLPARVVYVDPASGAGLELIGCGPTMKERLAELAKSAAAPRQPPAVPELEADLGADGLLTLAADGDDDSDGDGDGDDDSDGDGDGDDDSDSDSDGDGNGDGDGQPARAGNLQERLRGLSLAEQVRKAQSSDPATRMALERMYGKAVWEALLRNPRLTAPEVARLARMGTLPRVQLETIVTNSAWLQIPEVRRALLSNPRLGTDQILRVLRLMPKHELKVASTATAYPFAVRDQAKKLLKND
ncbi:MAG: hypothetical protein JNL83_32595 [Myxococcales bacterium]|nr:hypothetical protein [Myxococcales bacterium]